MTRFLVYLLALLFSLSGPAMGVNGDFGRCTLAAKGGAPKIKAKDRRAQQQADAKEKKHGDADFEEPASEDYAKWKAKELEKSAGKDARRAAHDKKRDGIDRTKRQLDDDYDE